MRPDQIKRLHELSDRLADAFISEADPQTWPGPAEALAEASTKERGDRYWCKRNAMATGGVLRLTLDLVDRSAPAHGADDGDDELDRRIADAEKRASDALKRVMGSKAHAKRSG